ncbi:winged helix-turn-helix domain-containing protein [Salinispora vitiensis]|uniref:winged helix-turn-helix domain-containing protein n=1 Tax=Salinispora vitiensis TaxID=999544 RepID=UPI0003A4BBF1|nr:helix-turn-helix domain-containing protein [Salinispora vitiensis]
MAPGSSRRLKNVAELRMLTHPLRLRLFYALTAAEEATASRLAELVDESLSLVSYHLRELAAHGFIEEVPRRSGDRRERWWRKTHEGFSFAGSEFAGDPQARGVAVAAKRQLLAHQISRLERWIDEDHAWGEEWTDASLASESLLRLTAPELAELSAELTAVAQKWAERGRVGAEDRPDAPAREHVLMFMHAFPFQP